MSADENAASGATPKPKATKPGQGQERAWVHLSHTHTFSSQTEGGPVGVLGLAASNAGVGGVGGVGGGGGGVDGDGVDGATYRDAIMRITGRSIAECQRICIANGFGGFVWRDSPLPHQCVASFRKHSPEQLLAQMEPLDEPKVVQNLC